MASFDGTVLNALREAQAALTQYARHLEQNAQLQVARNAARETMALQRRLGEGGTLSPLEVLDAERTLAQSECALIASDAGLASDRVQIFMALGGGWEQ